MVVNETMNCPACNFVADEFFSECPKCGIIVGKYHEKQAERQRVARQTREAERAKRQQDKLSTKATEEKMRLGVKGGGAGFVSGLPVAFFALCVGMFFLIIPVIGWVLGPITILTAFCIPFIYAMGGMKQGANLAGSTVIRGNCPYCTGSVNVTVYAEGQGKVVGVDCPICKKRFVVKGQAFCRV